jgi:glycosyltransferase involved in cell wall biosynthesis
LKVSVVINCCYEGLLLRKAIGSALWSIESSGFAEECELIVVADSPTKTTVDVLAGYRERLQQFIVTDHSDLGLARNSGGEAAQGELVLFLDGDDLWSRNWVGAAWSSHLISPAMTILHPQYAVFFGARSEILVHPDWRDPYFDPRGLVARNHWISLCGIRREDLLQYPFPKANRSYHFGFEDWSWYADLVAKGFRHATVPGTAHFIRLKAANSMNESMGGFNRIPSLDFAEYLAADDPSRPYNL